MNFNGIGTCYILILYTVDLSSSLYSVLKSIIAGNESLFVYLQSSVQKHVRNEDKTFLLPIT